ncbi:MAG TPA: hypothetical protein VFP72_11160, partial [Kineosporiaceae bacterium]|nr:hypothetical protein [Kineosporiaceae bacterium]
APRRPYRHPASAPVLLLRAFNRSRMRSRRPTRKTGHPQTHEDREAQEAQWRAQTVPGRTGIPEFKLRSNDRRLVTAAEVDQALAAWVRWLDLARQRGGFEAE